MLRRCSFAARSQPGASGKTAAAPGWPPGRSGGGGASTVGRELRCLTCAAPVADSASACARPPSFSDAAHGASRMPKRRCRCTSARVRSRLARGKPLGHSLTKSERGRAPRFRRGECGPAAVRRSGGLVILSPHGSPDAGSPARSACLPAPRAAPRTASRHLLRRAARSSRVATRRRDRHRSGSDR